jgi:predicted acetyltransferase
MELRAATREEFDAFSESALWAFHRILTDEDRLRYEKIDEPDRSLAWFDDDGRIVATTGAFTRALTIPGAVAPCAGVTAVAVVPTHRRRGLLTSMMRRQLDDLRERGDALAILWASEARIYGRYGYGVATRMARLSARRPQAVLAHPVAGEGPLRAGPAGEFVEAMRAVHERVRVERPGMLDRPGPWWEDRLDDPESRRNGAQPLQAVTVPDGYAIYAVRPDWGDDGPAGDVGVRELVAATPEARARLWAFLLDQDLTSTISWRTAPVDEPLSLMLSDARALRATVVDALWLRLVDVAAALAARSYVSDPAVVLDVTDAFCPWNAGRYRVADGGCERADDASPDLALDVRALAAAYLGGTTLLSLAAAGLVRELTPGAVARASAALRWPVEPWCPESF